LKTFSGLIPAPKEGEAVAEIDLSQTREGNNNIAVRKEDLKLPPGVIVNRVKPAFLKITVEKKARKWLRVDAKVIGMLPGKHRLRRIKVEPSVVMVEGPESTLSRLEGIDTEEINLSEVRQNAILEKKLILPASQVRVISDVKVKLALTH